MADEPIYRAIKELKEELARIDYVIQAVESVAEGKLRRGRPPKFLAEIKRRKGGKRKSRKKSGKS